MAAALKMENDPDAKLYGDITDWDTTEVTTFYILFDKTSVQSAVKFNEDIGNWDTSLGEYFTDCFRGAESFDQDIGAWDMSTAVYAFGMFQGALIAESFDQDIGAWDMSNAIYTSGMFQGAHVFNQDISLWEVGEVKNFYNMFINAQGFNQDLSLWDFGSAKYVEQMFWYSGLNINQCFDLSGTGDPNACEIFKGSAGGDDLFCDVGMC
eukprot:CAMPEP_0194297898 /NCGR_PEP_ID=MMETSP0169-20130528/59868_1 /TAXON_ID=218684 /ORGANISM="Corethron pennatum, Strain L29A3" /LENGTH=208 /DNA_ID=CAMNT_0039047825 /DNA_START=127 /DNA_END=753 /DNA_ORIENTATION=+